MSNIYELVGIVFCATFAAHLSVALFLAAFWVWSYIASPWRLAPRLIAAINMHPQRPDETEAEYVDAQATQTFRVIFRPSEILNGKGDNYGFVPNNAGTLSLANFDAETGLLHLSIRLELVPIGYDYSIVEPHAVFLKDYEQAATLTGTLAMSASTLRTMAEEAYWIITFRPDNLRRYSSRDHHGPNQVWIAPVKFSKFALVSKGRVIWSIENLAKGSTGQQWQAMIDDEGIGDAVTLRRLPAWPTSAP